MIFVDASAIVAILTLEADATRLVDQLEEYDRRLTSAIAIFEATLGICRKRHTSVQEAFAVVQEFLRVANVETLPIGAGDARGALDAHARYGKGRGHPAQLNLGDCFAYAVAASRSAKLLFTGEDFDKTDINA